VSEDNNMTETVRVHITEDFIQEYLVQVLGDNETGLYYHRIPVALLERHEQALKEFIAVQNALEEVMKTPPTPGDK
jgi:rhamnogalacturonyl hydrolase YesR